MGSAFFSFAVALAILIGIRMGYGYGFAAFFAIFGLVILMSGSGNRGA